MTPKIQDYLKDGSQFGIKISYKIQNEPKGIAESFILGKIYWR